MRPILVVAISFTCACGAHKSELDETLEWMDNTYNRHEAVSGADGHGRWAWYAPSEIDLMHEVMASGHKESFAYKGCEMT